MEKGLALAYVRAGARAARLGVRLYERPDDGLPSGEGLGLEVIPEGDVVNAESAVIKASPQEVRSVATSGKDPQNLTLEKVVNARRALLLIALRAGSGLTQKELADRVGLSRPMINKYERNVVTPTDDSLRKIGEGIGHYGTGVLSDSSRPHLGNRLREANDLIEGALTGGPILAINQDMLECLTEADPEDIAEDCGSSFDSWVVTDVYPPSDWTIVQPNVTVSVPADSDLRSLMPNPQTSHDFETVGRSLEDAIILILRTDPEGGAKLLRNLRTLSQEERQRVAAFVEGLTASRADPTR